MSRIFIYSFHIEMELHEEPDNLDRKILNVAGVVSTHSSRWVVAKEKGTFLVS